jgi:hypothetical protein
MISLEELSRWELIEALCNDVHAMNEQAQSMGGYASDLLSQWMLELATICHAGDPDLDLDDPDPDRFDIWTAYGTLSYYDSDVLDLILLSLRRLTVAELTHLGGELDFFGASTLY